MKKNNLILVLLLAVATLPACKKNNGTPNAKPAVTPVGTNNGTPVSQTIGSAGGTIVSDDGEMELVIPAGALTANTVITIQPVTNNAPNGRRKAYRCTPDGQQFAKNITVKFHYTDEDAAATEPEYMLMAFQTADGTWQVLDDITNDVTGTTITASVNHFTDFTAFDVMRIDPAALYLKPGEKGQYLVTATGMSLVNGARLLNELEDNPENWKVNGETGGNSTLGTIVRIGNESKAEYTAPATMPPTNPVSISVEMNFSFIIDGQQFNRGILTARAYIIGNRYRVELEYKGNSAVGTGEEFRVDDNVRMTVNLVGAEGTVTGAINVPPTFTKIANSTNGCNTTFTSNGTGPINLRDIDAAGVQRNGVTGDVYVFFNSDVGVVPAVMQIICPTSTQTKDFLPWSSAGAVLTFKDNGQSQVINMSQVSSQSIKLMVTPLQ